MESSPLRSSLLESVSDGVGIHQSSLAKHASKLITVTLEGGDNGGRMVVKDGKVEHLSVKCGNKEEYENAACIGEVTTVHIDSIHVLVLMVAALTLEGADVAVVDMRFMVVAWCE
jgi:hypothetical protein